MTAPRYFGSMAGRLFVFLLIGVVTSASLALGVADMRRQADMHGIRVARLVDRVQDFVAVANSTSAPARARLARSGVPGLLPINSRQKTMKTDDELSQRLSRALSSPVNADRIDPRTCFDHTVARTAYYKMNCWRVSSKLADGTPFNLTLIGQAEDSFRLTEFEPVYLLILVLGVGLLTFLAARMAAAPLADLSRAARALGGDLNSLPLPERGPNEVRDAIEAFNTMQAKLRTHVVERTKILASITHDLQTPLTRLRLRLEKVSDVALRSRLIDDLQGMQMLIREGLEFSRGTQIDEPFAPIALDSLLESLVEDAVEMGRKAVLVNRTDYDVEARPRALQRCLGNLLDNALKYAGAAEISTEVADQNKLVVRVRDHGPGIATDELERIFEPFVRLENPAARKVEGAGLGLTIARMLAAKNDAELVLSNHPDGGVEALLILSRGLRPNHGFIDWAARIGDESGALIS